MSSVDGDPSAAKVWFILRNGRRFGPFTAPELRRLAHAGKIKPDDHVLHPTRPRGSRADTIDGLLPTRKSILAPRRKTGRTLFAGLVLAALAAASAVVVLQHLAPESEQRTPAVAAGPIRASRSTDRAVDSAASREGEPGSSHDLTAPLDVEPAASVQGPDAAVEGELPHPPLPRFTVPEVPVGPVTRPPQWAPPRRALPPLPAPTAPAEPATPMVPTVAPVEKKFVGDRRIESALLWLVKKQEANGSWRTNMGNNRPAILVTTSFAGLALMASGGPFDEPIHKAAAYVRENLFAERSPELPPEWDQRNWNIGIGGLFLCEFYHWLEVQPGTTPADREEVARAIQRCVDESCQRTEPSGGWGHTPRLKNPLGYVELEVMSNWHLAMLGAARRSGRTVPPDKIKRAAQFIENCCKSGQGGVGYSPYPGQKGNGCPCLTGGALFAYAMAGQQKQPQYSLMVRYWADNVQDSNEGHASLAMGMLTSGLGARQLGAPTWTKFRSLFSAQVFAAQAADGSFAAIAGKSFKARTGSDGRVGPTYTTAIYTLLLELDSNRLKYLGRRQP